jgi:hypothetical protein
MKTSMKLDVVSANDMTYDHSVKRPKQKSRKDANNGQAKEIVDSLGGKWGESKWGAELKSQADDVSATANVFKKANGKYGCRLNIDASFIGNMTDSDSPQACIDNILVGIDSIAKSCSELSRDAFLKTTETDATSQEDTSVQKQLSDITTAELSEEN